MALEGNRHVHVHVGACWCGYIPLHIRRARADAIEKAKAGR